MKTASLIVMVLFAAACTQRHPPTDSLGAAQEARSALLEMVNHSGNRWMGEDLQDHKIVRDGGDYYIGRWTFNLHRMTFVFNHTNDRVKPPIMFEVSGVFERDATGKLTARVTGTKHAG